MAKVFAYQPCLDCVKCAPGVRGAARASWIVWVHLFTIGISFLIAKAMRCPRCSHTTLANAHRPVGHV